MLMPSPHFETLDLNGLVDVVCNAKHTGRPRLLHYNDVEYLICLTQHQPDCFLDELLNLLKHNRFISVHYTTIHRELKRAGMSTKILKEIAEERSEPSRLDDVREISQYPADYLGFLDETSSSLNIGLHSDTLPSTQAALQAPLPEFAATFPYVPLRASTLPSFGYLRLRGVEAVQRPPST
ncbi:hypothetical protein B0H13DRAFT_2360572 [Mycena leptocephala]|nr:hypothetical protein B0H13DRAFT_2360572 [Mycena leptocephala]